LEGVIAGESAISTIDEGLSYRGYSVEELADHATFEEVAYLVLRGERPDREQLKSLRRRLLTAAELGPPIMERLHPLPAETSLMDAMRSAASLAGHFLPAHFADAQDDVTRADYLTGLFPVVMCGLHRMRQGQQPLAPRTELSLAGNVLWMVSGKEPDGLAERAMNVSMILYAEHGFNASTFACRVVASTLSDLYSGITAAVGALKGPLHGGANERVVDVLAEVREPKQAAGWIDRQLEQKKKIMGFGHRVYKSGDPRAAYLKSFCRELAQRSGSSAMEETAEAIERELADRKGLLPNVDWPAGRMYHYLGLAVDLYTPLFVCSRVVGWAAHFIEQQANNRILRPRSNYIGPPPRRWQSSNS
jgi:citrate synthase